MAATSLNLGQYLYRPIRQIDETKMSTLWVADEETHGQTPPSGGQVIIKIARMSETRYSLTNQRAIENEEKWLIALDHPNVVRLRPIAEKHSSRQTIYRARSDLPGSPWFLVTDYLPGGDLYTLLGDREKLSASLSLEIAERVGSALAYLHARKCVHCDIKPRNILFRQRPHGFRLTPETQPIVIDFGIAKNPTEGPQLASGTPRWITPELADALTDGRKIEVDPSWDVYALGLVLYTMVSGRKPDLNSPGRASWQAVTASDLAGDPSVKEMTPLVRGLNELITQTTAPRARDRLSAADFTDRVQQLLRLVQTPHVAVVPPPQRRNPWWVWAGAAAALLVVALLAWMARPSQVANETPGATVVAEGGDKGSAGDGLTPPATGSRDEGLPGAAPGMAPALVPTSTPVATRKPTSTPVNTQTHTPTSTFTNTPRPTATVTPRPPTHTPTMTSRPPTITPTRTTAAISGVISPTSTKASPTVTRIPTTTPTLRPPPVSPTSPPAILPPGAPPDSGDMRVTLNEPADGFAGQGPVRFSWTPGRALASNECFEVRFWQGDAGNWMRGWGIWGANRDSSVTRNFDESFEATMGGNLRKNAAYFWGVLLVENCDAYRNNMFSNLRLVSPPRIFTYGAADN